MITMTKDKLNISINEDLKIQLKILAVKEKKTVSDIISELVQQYIDEHS